MSSGYEAGGAGAPSRLGEGDGARLGIFFVQAS